MTDVAALWLPILVASVAIFIVSALIHTISPWHKGDYPRVPNEDKVVDALRPLAIPPGDYMVPRPASHDQMRSPEFAEKRKKGPVLLMTVIPNGPLSMGKSLGLWFIYLVVVTVFAAFSAGRVLPPGAEARRIVEFVGLPAFLAYTLALFQMSIWFHRAWSTTWKTTVDGLIYALLTAGAFVWLWPR